MSKTRNKRRVCYSVWMRPGRAWAITPLVNTKAIAVRCLLTRSWTRAWGELWPEACVGLLETIHRRQQVQPKDRKDYNELYSNARKKAVKASTKGVGRKGFLMQVLEFMLVLVDQTPEVDILICYPNHSGMQLLQRHRRRNWVCSISGKRVWGMQLCYTLDEVRASDQEVASRSSRVRFNQHSA